MCKADIIYSGTLRNIKVTNEQKHSSLFKGKRQKRKTMCILLDKKWNIATPQQRETTTRHRKDKQWCKNNGT